MATFLSDLLSALKVKHTQTYSDKRFRQMPFQTLFGVSHLLGEYGVESVGVKVEPQAKQEALQKFATPFVIDTLQGLLIVTRVDNTTVDYLSQGQSFTLSVDKVVGAWNGIALLVEASPTACESEYNEHHLVEMVNRLKKWILGACAVALLGVGMWLSGLASHWAAWPVLLFDIIGLALSWMLVQKALGIHTKAADSVCSVLQPGGCDEIARSEAASFFGIFKWSEVGLAYFSVSLLTLLLFPQTLPVLAAINILCLPYSFWSIWYQGFKAKTWCTMCVGVQATLWLLFASYLAGGWTHHIVFNGAFWLTFLILGAVYVTALLALNRLDNALEKYFNVKNDVNS